MIALFQDKRRRVFVFIVVGALFISAALVFFAWNALAQSGTLPFGGRVTFVEYCTCSGGAVVTVGTPRGGRFLYLPGSTRVYEYYRIPVVGVWLLGNYRPGVGICLAGDKLCSPIPHQGLITIVGTSR